MNSELSWRKSSFSGGSGGDCMEVADRDGRVLVRDTKAYGRSPVHRYTDAEWREFVAGVKAAEPGRDAL
jgi:hypothetical protein